MSTIPGSKRKRRDHHHVKADNDNNDDDIPIRNLEKLYCSSVTVSCALEQGCIPCAYKIGAFDVALDSEFTRLVPNRRPEECPRASPSTGHAQDGRTLGYRPGLSVLTVGDGDFSFSLAVARLLVTNSHTKPNLMATSYESEETLRKVYQNYDATSTELKNLGATLGFQVDATKLSDTNNNNPIPPTSKWDRICWNFPCTAIGEGKDGQNDAMEANRQLVREFVDNAKSFLNPLGEIHMCHKTKPPFNQWRIEEVAVEKCTDTVQYRGRVVFDRCLLLPYQPRKALHRKSFPCHDACIYVFQVTNGQYTATGGVASTIPLEKASNTIEDEKSGENKQGLVPVTKDLILRIRSNHLTQASAAKAKAKNNKNKKRK